jgi:cbb3-type cytochrome oxidase subunit 3
VPGHQSTFMRERKTMRKFLAIVMAGLFAAVSVNAFAQAKKDEPKKEAGKKDEKKAEKGEKKGK